MLSFDGQYGRIINHLTGPYNQPFRANRGEILPEAPYELWSSWRNRGTGAAFSTQFFFADQGRAFTEVMRQAKALGAQISLTMEQYDGVNCIRISSGDKRGYEAFWLDPSRGYALLGHEQVGTGKDGEQVVFGSDRVTRLVEAAPGIWYPAEAIHTSGRQAGQPETRLVFRASAVVANDPQFNESVFAPAFPTGYTVNDRVSGLVYVAGTSPQSLRDDFLEKAIVDALSSRPTATQGSASRSSTKPHAPASGPSQGERAKAPAERQERETGIGFGSTAGIASAVLIAVAMVGIAIWRYRRNTTQ